jgi:hypothetical protein
VIFASFSLFAAARLVRKRRLPVDRVSLRMPFYAQCYPTAIFALGLGLGVSLAIVDHPVAQPSGVILAVASILNYVIVETRWFAAKLEIGYIRALGEVILVLLEGLVLLTVVGFLFTR